MFLVFYKTGDVFEAEEIIEKLGVQCDIVPTPVSDRAYCGVCVQIAEQASGIVLNALKSIEYIVIRA